MKKKWTREATYEEAKKYSSRGDFIKGNKVVYEVARINGWLDDYKWFKPKMQCHDRGYWTRETCLVASKKYKSRTEFEKSSPSAYHVALKNGWLEEYTWLVKKKRENGYWKNHDRCMEVAKRCGTLKDFYESYPTAYDVSRKNGWLDEFVWLVRKPNLREDNVYAYIFVDLKAVYIGRTIQPEIRHQQHLRGHGGSSVYKFAQENNIPLPEMTILELKISDGREKEHYYVTKYRNDGWNVLNKGATGSRSGALGAIACGKWNKKTCHNEAKRYNSRKKFANGSPSAYCVALKNGWLEEYTWFINANKIAIENRRKYTHDYCYSVAQQYKTAADMEKNDSGAYHASIRNGWRKEYTWFLDGNKLAGQRKTKWNEESCRKIAKECKTRSELHDKHPRAYHVALKNGWLEEYTWLISPQKPKNYWNYERCFEAASKCSNRRELKDRFSGAYNVALKNGWIETYTWFIKRA